MKKKKEIENHKNLNQIKNYSKTCNFKVFWKENKLKFY